MEVAGAAVTAVGFRLARCWPFAQLVAALVKTMTDWLGQCAFLETSLKNESDQLWRKGHGERRDGAKRETADCPSWKAPAPQNQWTHL